MGEGPVAPPPPLRERIQTGTMLSQEHFDASMQAMNRAQNMVLDTLRDLTLHGLGNPPKLHLSSTEEFSICVA